MGSRFGKDGVAVVGAGPYGLAVSAHLSARGVPHRVFGRVMSTWSDHMPEGMLLKSRGSASSLADPHRRLTLRAFCAERGEPYADTGVPIPRDVFVAQGRWFQERLVPHVEATDIVHLSRGDDGFVVRTAMEEEFRCQSVVLAVGVGAFSYVPPVVAALPREFVSHTCDHNDLSTFSGRRVVVIGGGQAALESAVLLNEAGAEPEILVRAGRVRWTKNPSERQFRDKVLFPMCELGSGWLLQAYSRRPESFRLIPDQRRAKVLQTALGPAGAWWLRPRAEGLPITASSSVVDARVVNGRARLVVASDTGQRVMEADHVLAGTGFRVDLNRLRFLDDPLRRSVATYAGYPLLDSHFGSSVPGLSFVGLTAALTFGPGQRFVQGSRAAAERVASALGSPSRLRGSRPTRDAKRPFNQKRSSVRWSEVRDKTSVPLDA